MEIPSEELMTRDLLDRERGRGATSLISVDGIHFGLSYMYAYASGAMMPQACAKYCWLPSTLTVLSSNS
jgi:hypothetical protein